MESLTIGEVAQRAGLRPSAIRYYESAGILPKPRRVSGQRRYAPDILHLLHAVNVAKQAGFSISEMQQLFRSIEDQEAPSAAWERLAHRKLAEIDDLIQRAQSMKLLLEEGLRCGCLGIEQCTVLGYAVGEIPS